MCCATDRRCLSASLQGREGEKIFGVEVADEEAGDEDETAQADAARLLLVDSFHAHVSNVCSALVRSKEWVCWLRRPVRIPQLRRTRVEAVGSWHGAS